jgi:hypothetical protein
VNAIFDKSKCEAYGTYTFYVCVHGVLDIVCAHLYTQYYWTFYNVISFSADAKLVLSTYYGVGNNKVDIDMYTYMDGGMQSTLSVTKDGCVPMAEHMKMSTGILDIGFMGLTLGIKDMSVFDIPKGCQNAATVHPYSPVSI